MPGSGTTLHTTQVGEAGPLVAFCHGLFGQGKNWTSVARTLAEDGHRCLLVDMPNHGRSPWRENVDYVAMADEVAQLFSADDPVALVGHSMGGKAAMVLALRHPELVERLCVVDMSPVAYDGTVEGGFTPYVSAMRSVDLSALTRRGEADEQMREGVPSATIRGFLLQNLRQDRESGTWGWQMNLDALGDHLGVLGGWPEDALSDLAPYDGPALWVAGAESDYVRAEYAPAMERWFPHVRKVTIKGAGHWVHSEQPEVFTEVLRRFLR
ncbi:alpha/beta hydrolase [Marmoricola endophyticus]|uniref:Alpha/beta hydrolase n=1 Tax=Marmoricola endophyticus TaxID=2040280 RepID=A0A917F6L6_9ACTN|nr:alpha/beta fold hydrolase [Marmoricola endophyticus]GGF55971.1 alpha/beta hydrolase [Marmoricola endophyticus]